MIIGQRHAKKFQNFVPVIGQDLDMSTLLRQKAEKNI